MAGDGVTEREVGGSGGKGRTFGGLVGDGGVMLRVGDDDDDGLEGEGDDDDDVGGGGR